VPRFHIAEDVLPGHPDRLADAVAEAVVDHAVAIDPDALVGVEVAVHRNAVFVTGRIAAGNEPDMHRLFSPSLARQAYWDAGYRGRWGLVRRHYAGRDGRSIETPDALEIAVHTDLDLGPLSSDERSIRCFSDDQNHVVGHAEGTIATGYLPAAHFVARRMREAVDRLRENHDEVLGPDGKVWIRLLEDETGIAWDRCNVSVQHAPGIGYEELHELVLPAIEQEIESLSDALPGIEESWCPERLRLNGAGDFSCGGPFGDNGLSGKKLVVDHYGPSVPIGGGALCGKDPHKVDRIGALRARQLAVRLVRDAGASHATVRLGWLPGLEAPSFVDALVDGEVWDEARIAKATAIPDLSIAATFRDLELDGVKWREVLRRGYFGSGSMWG
jgi:S-adenosylmethionine synthetase